MCKLETPKFRKKYEEKCFKHFKQNCDHDDCRIRYKTYFDNITVFYYYDDEELFDVNKDIDILRQFLKKCKFYLYNWNTDPVIGKFNSTETNYSDILFNHDFKFLTRLDIKKH